MASGKLIENLSFEELVHICNLTRRIDFANVKINEKGISWDGELTMYSSEKNFENGKKEGKEKRVPIQLKGKKASKDALKETIKFPVDKRDILNYYNNSGCLFLVVLIMPDTTRHMYYEILSRQYISGLDQFDDNKEILVGLTKVRNAQDFLEIVHRAYLILNNKIKKTGDKITIKRFEPNKTLTLKPSAKYNGNSVSLIIEEDNIIHEITCE